jgi:hypothetical protein
MSWDTKTEERLSKSLEADEVVTIERSSRTGEIDVQGDIEDALDEIDRLRGRLVEMYERVIPEEIAKGCAEERTKREQAEAEVLDTRAYLQTATDYAGLMDQRIAKLEAALKKWQRLALVVESAMRSEMGRDERSQPQYESVLEAIKATLAAQEPKP